MLSRQYWFRSKKQNCKKKTFFLNFMFCVCISFLDDRILHRLSLWFASLAGLRGHAWPVRYLRSLSGSFFELKIQICKMRSRDLRSQHSCLWFVIRNIVKLMAHSRIKKSVAMSCTMLCHLFPHPTFLCEMDKPHFCSFFFKYILRNLGKKLNESLKYTL